MQRNTDQLTCSELMADGGRMTVGYADGALRHWSLGLNVEQVPRGVV